MDANELKTKYTAIVKAYLDNPCEATIEAYEAFEAAYPEVDDIPAGAVFVTILGTGTYN